MRILATVNTATAPAQPLPGAPASHSPTVSHEPDHDLADDDSILSDPPPESESMPLGMQMDGVIEHHDHHDGAEHPEHATDEPNPKKRKRYNDPPNEVRRRRDFPKTVLYMNMYMSFLYASYARADDSDVKNDATILLRGGFAC